MYRSLLVKNSKLIPSKGLLLKCNISPVSSRVLLHNSAYVRNNNKVKGNQPNTSTKASNKEKQKPFESEPKSNNGNNNNNSRNAKILSLLAISGALYFVSPYKPSFMAKKIKEEVAEKKEDEFVEEPTTTEETSKIDNDHESNEEEVVNQETKASDEGDAEKLDKTEEGEVGQEGAYNEETGEINWDCECLGGMAYGPCGEEFKEAFACFVYSGAEPKGIDCVEKFQTMQTCFRKHPEHYADQLKDDEEVNEELIQQIEQERASADSSKDTLTDVSLESSPEVNGEEAIIIDQETVSDISKEEPVMVEDASKPTPQSTDNDPMDPMEEVELTESS